jgi:hypothetical protein
MNMEIYSSSHQCRLDVHSEIEEDYRDADVGESARWQLIKQDIRACEWSGWESLGNSKVPRHQLYPFQEQLREDVHCYLIVLM